MDEGKRKELLALRERGLPPKAIARHLGLRPAEVSAVLQEHAARSADPVAAAPRLVKCLLSPGWGAGLGLMHIPRGWRALDRGETGAAAGLVSALVVREHRYDKVTATGFLVDVYCLGVKDALPPKTMERHELDSFIAHYYRSYEESPIEAPIDLIQSLVFGAVEYARSLGFEPHRDFASARPALGEWTGPSPIAFGNHGVPEFIQGPHDNPKEVYKTLCRTVGEGNFHFMVAL
jgi:hypothetical protein